MYKLKKKQIIYFDIHCIVIILSRLEMFCDLLLARFGLIEKMK